MGTKRRNEQETLSRNNPFSYRAEYTADGNTEFEAWADPGAKITDAIWLCAKSVYDNSQQLTKTLWAKDSKGRVGDFTNKASDLSSLDYV